MATKKHLIEAGDLWSEIMMLPHNGDMISSEEVEQAIINAPAVDALILPCKMGTTIYMIVTSRHRIGLPEFSFIKTTYMTESNFFRVIRNFGKTVFLTREEAEAALAKMKG